MSEKLKNIIGSKTLIFLEVVPCDLTEASYAERIADYAEQMQTLEEQVAAIAAGGWVAVVVIIVICLIALIVGSAFGIFFSSESNGKNDMTMQQVVREINEDYQNRIETIKANNPYDDLEMSGSRAVWPQVLSVYWKVLLFLTVWMRIRLT